MIDMDRHTVGLWCALFNRLVLMLNFLIFTYQHHHHNNNFFICTDTKHTLLTNVMSKYKTHVATMSDKSVETLRSYWVP